MAGRGKDLAALLPKKIPVDKLVLGKTMQHVVVRVLRMWEARNFKLNGTLMSLDLLLLDEKETLIQGSIFHRRLDTFRHLLNERKIYLISNFEVVPTYSHYKVTDNPFTIRFLDTTQLMELDEAVCSIKLEKFRLHSYADFQNLVGTNLHLLDVLGQILQVQGPNLDTPTSKQKIILLLLLEDNSTIRLTLWDDQASQFRLLYQQTEGHCNVVVCTCLNPKMFAGKLHLNTTGATRIFLNYELQVVQTFMKRMGIERTDSSPAIVEDNSGKVNMEIWTIEQILEYVSSGANMEKEVICHATIDDISGRNGWKYLSCGTCSKKLGRSATSLVCNVCNKSTTIGIQRFRLELVVHKGENTTTFVLFDRDARNLTNTTAEEIINSEEPESQGSTSIPSCLLEIVGQTLYFQVKISDYNFQSSNQTFTVSRIVEEDSIQGLDRTITATKFESSENDNKEENEQKIKSEDGEKNPTFHTTEDLTSLANEETNEETSETESKKQRII